MRVTIVPIDQVILVDKEPLFFSFTAEADVHAIQWSGDSGHIEYKDVKPHKRLSGESDFETYVLPFVTQWETEKTRVLAEPQALEEKYAEEIAQEQQAE